MLLFNDTLDSIIERLAKNKDIMKLMDLPYVSDTDSDKIKAQKMNFLIKKMIVKSVQVPKTLGEKVKPIMIDKINYDKYGGIKITVSIIQSVPLNSDIFGNPRIEINIYYDNKNPDKALKILDLISNEFSGKNLKVEWEEEGKKYIVNRELKCEGSITQNPNINNYESVGIRFSFFVSHYVPYN